VICALCRNGTVRPGTVTVTLQRGRTTVILKEVPADVCPNCGEYYLSTDTTTRVLERADAAAQSGAEVEIAAFAA
jgi:YgiT-type zinc finger domain-containing protein